MRSRHFWYFKYNLSAGWYFAVLFADSDSFLMIKDQFPTEIIAAPLGI